MLLCCLSADCAHSISDWRLTAAATEDARLAVVDLVWRILVTGGEWCRTFRGPGSAAHGLR